MTTLRGALCALAILTAYPSHAQTPYQQLNQQLQQNQLQFQLRQLQDTLDTIDSRQQYDWARRQEQHNPYRLHTYGRLDEE